MYLAYVFYFPFVSPIFRASSLPTSSISRRSSTPPSTFHSLLIPPLIFAVSSEPGYSEIQIDSRARDKSYFPLKNRYVDRFKIRQQCFNIFLLNFFLFFFLDPTVQRSSKNLFEEEWNLVRRFFRAQWFGRNSAKDTKSERGEEVFKCLCIALRKKIHLRKLRHDCTYVRNINLVVVASNTFRYIRDAV